MKFEDYSKRYNKICLLYTGHLLDYVIQLDYIVPFVRKRFEDLEVHLCVRDDMVSKTKDAISFSSFDESKYGYVRNFKINPSGLNPIYEFIKDSGIIFPHLKTKKSKSTLLIPYANFPARSLTESQIKQINYCVLYSGKENIEDYGHVIGAENDKVFLAASLGIKTTLVDTGPGTDLFKVIFPHGEILKLY